MKLGELPSHIRFIIFSIILFLISFLIAYIYMMAVYDPAYEVSINNTTIGYVKSESEFNRIYAELQNEYIVQSNNVKIWTETEPKLIKTYTKETVLEKQNIYIALRNELKIEFTQYAVNINGEQKLIFNDISGAEEYKTKILELSNNINIEIIEVKSASLQSNSNIEIADNLYNDLASRYRPIRSTTNYYPTISRYISSYFGWRNMGGYVNYHTGIDLAGSYYDPIYAYKSGRVTLSGWNGSYGYCIKILHNDGTQTLYGHCASLEVSNGADVIGGQVIAHMGSTGWSTGTHLHFEVLINNIPVNPYSYIF